MTDQMLSVDEALESVLARVEPLPDEPVELRACVGRYLAQDVHAGLDLPPFTNSAMDGYAVRVVDTPGTLRVIGESAAGRPFGGSLGPGEAVAISTGAEIPRGADSVVMIERVTLVASGAGQTITVDQARARDCFREAGSDVRTGALVIPARTLIRPAQIGAAAALGLSQLPCVRRPRVAVIPTGDELRVPGEPLGPGQIYNSNGPMLRALIEDAGAQAVEIAAVGDTDGAHRTAMRAALEYDLVITSGGVSVGPHDLVRAVGAELGIEELFWRIRLRPGKPLSFGVRRRTAEPPTLVFGLPGNPVSTLVCFELFVRPALAAMQGARQPRPAFREGVLARAIRRNPERDELVRVWLDAAGELDPLPEQQSHQITISAQADGLVRIPSGTGNAAAGSTVSYLPLREH